MTTVHFPIHNFFFCATTQLILFRHSFLSILTRKYSTSRYWVCDQFLDEVDIVEARLSQAILGLIFREEILDFHYRCLRAGVCHN